MATNYPELISSEAVKLPDKKLDNLWYINTIAYLALIIIFAVDWFVDSFSIHIYVYVGLFFVALTTKFLRRILIIFQN